MMETKQFKDYNCDLIDLQESIEVYFIDKGYTVTNFHKDRVYATQAHKKELEGKSIISKITGIYADFEISLGMSEQINNIGNIPTILEQIPLHTKILLGEPFLERDFWNLTQNNIELRRDTYRNSQEIPPQQTQIIAEREITREIEVVYCTYCGAKNNASLVTCSQCGAKLH